LLAAVLLTLGSLLPTATQAAQDPTAGAATGYGLSDPTIAAYYRQHGGAAALGAPISNPMRLSGNRVQLFQRQAIEVRPDGSVGTLNLVDGGFLPLTAIAGPGLAPDPGLLAHLPMAGTPDYLQAVATYLDAAAPNDWNGMPVRFGATFRSMLRCTDLVGIAACDNAGLLSAANDLWGLPTASPVVDPHSPDFVYLRFQRGVMVHSRKAGETQWLLLGELFKQVLLGRPLPPEILSQITASPLYSRFYAQYDPQARDGVVRPAELPNTSLVGAFVDTPTPVATAAPASAPQMGAAAAAPPASLAPFVAPVRDTRFGVAEGFKDTALMAELHAGWERVVVPWDQVQPSGPGDFSHLGTTLAADRVRAEVSRGIRLAAVLQFTPDWAQADPSVGQRSVPKNLDLPFDDPQNYWGRFVYETVRAYTGQIDDWIIWNEPDFRASDPAGAAYTWAGTDEQFARLLAVAYLAAKKANPTAVVSFPATSYWVEELSTPRRTPFYERLLRILSADPRAAEHNFYHDAVALNLYRSPDDVYRVHSLFETIQRRYGIQRPIWLTETNAMPTDDVQIACADRPPSTPFRTTMDQQAAFAVQAFALAAAAGYQHAEFYAMQDGNTCQEPAWGLVRADGSRRPVADAMRTALNYFSHFTSARFVPLTRAQEAWPAWPRDPNSYLPNWQVYQVAFDRPANQRVTALWNGDGTALRVRIPKNGRSAKIVDRRGLERPAREDNGAWVVDLPAATTRGALDDSIKDPDGYHVIGGDAVLLVEEGVDPLTPVVAPSLAGN
jgi:hypothetical protein